MFMHTSFLLILSKFFCFSFSNDIIYSHVVNVCLVGKTKTKKEIIRAVKKLKHKNKKLPFLVSFRFETKIVDFFLDLGS